MSKFISFSGTANRLEFLAVTLAAFVILFGGFMLYYTPGVELYAFVTLAFGMWTYLSVLARRLRDLDCNPIYWLPAMLVFNYVCTAASNQVDPINLNIFDGLAFIPILALLFMPTRQTA